MKRSIQNIFAPFTVFGSLVKNRFSTRKKLALVTSPFTTNQTYNEKEFEKPVVSINLAEDYFTSFDLDLETRAFTKTKNNSVSPIFHSTGSNVTTPEIHREFNDDTPLVTTQWAELMDYDLLNDQKPDEAA
ncbi:hypothetical protein [uncultured Draconibacterium sp.]|uniref:hypothetical protein n=1 Tax=uncultured Draconibacterium sp. TaxID=1573823 RepID=UPI0032165049